MAYVEYTTPENFRKVIDSRVEYTTPENFRKVIDSRPGSPWSYIRRDLPSSHFYSEPSDYHTNRYEVFEVNTRVVTLTEPLWQAMQEVYEAHMKAMRHPMVRDAWNQYLVARELTR